MKLTLPKGSLEKATFDIFQRAFYKISGADRTYRPSISDPEIELKILRPQEIPVYVAEGMQDLGITGLDWINETGADVELVQNLEYGRVRIVAAAPKIVEHSSTNSMLENIWSQGKPVRISTEYLNLTAKYVKGLAAYRERFGDQEPLIVTPWWRKGENHKATIFLSFGATEAKPPEDADLIVEVTETGTSLEQNDLKILDTVIESTAHLITNKEALADPWKREKIIDVLTLLKGVTQAQKRLHIFVNVREENLETLLTQLPSLRRPTVSPLSTKGWFAINTVVEKKDFLQLLPTLRKLAQGLVVHEPQQVLSLEEVNGAVTK
ncbi:MAG TPA: ATP phosphoribosyltransferase [Candidatus Saccharimonadales bacterium]|nr:ATP phosphoribosyltransferase [Candidatus Saccharimonadales bacterium]